MKLIFARLIIAVLVAVSGSVASYAAIVTQWTFNGGSGVTTPSTGAGTASLIGGATATFASGDASGGSSDPLSGSTDFGWNTAGYPTTNINDETAGVQFAASTVGYEGISVSFDLRHSNTASRFWAVYYTTDGSTWNRFAVGPGNASPGATPSGGSPASTAGLFGTNGTFSAFDGTVPNAGDDWFNGRSFDLSSIPAVNNNPNFAFRIVSSFDGGTAYQASSSGVYGGGTARFDMVTINGTVPVPEPSTYALLGLGAAGLAYYRRRRTA
jgi:hypothetical protein